MSNVSVKTKQQETPPMDREEDHANVRYRRAGAFVFVSGAGRLIKQKDGSPDLKTGIREQTAACIEQLRAILEEAGGGLENLVDVTTYLANMNDYGGYNDVYSKYFTPDGPARTTVAVHQLSHPSVLIEIRGTAYIAEETRSGEPND